MPRRLQTSSSVARPIPAGPAPARQEPSSSATTQCHAVAIDGCAPKFDGGIVDASRLRALSGIVVIHFAGTLLRDWRGPWSGRYAAAIGGD